MGNAAENDHIVAGVFAESAHANIEGFDDDFEAGFVPISSDSSLDVHECLGGNFVSPLGDLDSTKSRALVQLVL